MRTLISMLALALAGVAGVQPREVFVVNTQDASVSRVDLSAVKEVGRFPVGSRPYGIAVTRRRRGMPAVIVACFGNDREKRHSPTVLHNAALHFWQPVHAFLKELEVRDACSPEHSVVLSSQTAADRLLPAAHRGFHEVLDFLGHRFA